jgi:hypothetical protein
MYLLLPIKTLFHNLIEFLKTARLRLPLPHQPGPSPPPHLFCTKSPLRGLHKRFCYFLPVGFQVSSAQNLFSKKEKKMKKIKEKNVCDGEFIKWPRPIKHGQGGGGMKI